MGHRRRACDRIQEAWRIACSKEIGRAIHGRPRHRPQQAQALAAEPPQGAVQVWDEHIEHIEGTVGLAQADIVTDAVCPLYQVSRLTGSVEFLTIPTWLVDLWSPG